MSGATVTVIDRARGIGPRAFDRTGQGSTTPSSPPDRRICNSAARGRDAHGISELALSGELAGKSAVVSSFGSELAVLLHMVAQINPNTPILFLNTGKKAFRRNLALSRPSARTARSWRFAVAGTASTECGNRRGHSEGNIAASGQSHAVVVLQGDAVEWLELFRPRLPAASGSKRKSAPRWRRSSSSKGGSASILWPTGRWRYLENYMVKYYLPRHPLVEDGYPSIGCMPCTRRVQAWRILSRRALVRSRKGRECRHPCRNRRRGRRGHLSAACPGAAGFAYTPPPIVISRLCAVVAEW